MDRPVRLYNRLITLVVFYSPLLFLLLFFSCSTIKSTNNRSEKLIIKAEEAITNGNYAEAEKIVQKAIQIDSTYIKAFLLLSDISDELNKRSQQIEALEKVVSLDSLKYPLAHKLLGNLYFDMGEYQKATLIYKRYQRFNVKSDSSVVTNRIRSSIFAHESILKNNKVLISIPGKAINTTFQEYWPAIATNDSLLYFTRLLINTNNFPYERIFESRLGTAGWEQAEELSLTGDENVNIGTMCISADGKLLFFTACGLKDGLGSCDIYYSRKADGKWSMPVNAGSVLNTPAWDAQPSVSSDNRHLFFASNRAGGCGGMDIWQCEIDEMKNGSLFFFNPKNLGKRVNTKENDFSPFIHADGSTLYYASEGKYGMGGSDIFISRLKDSIWSEAQNLGYPINSKFNDDGLVVSPTSKIAFFSSNREGTVAGSKDLFQLELPDSFLPEKVGYLAGKVFDGETGKCLEAKLKITSIETKTSKKVTSDVTDGYITTLKAGERYSLHVEKEGYLFYSRHFNLKNPSGFRSAERMDIFLEPVKAGQRFVLPNVFFDFDSDQLKPESDDELKKLIEFLNENPRLTIEISGHTDNVGNSSYNMELSTKRAKAIYNYLITTIDASRLTYTGYGPQMPVSTNDTEEGRALNRRCEIKILAN
jgi:outer membrane protein OmpA-like peptidoglycan-associated protein/tetratricopeptide (TPR) repeat protein